MDDDWLSVGCLLAILSATDGQPQTDKRHDKGTSADFKLSDLIPSIGVEGIKEMVDRNNTTDTEQ